jgi:hypothetical protein
MTLVLPEVLDRLGYSARDGDKITSISTANAAPEQGYRLRSDLSAPDQLVA